MIPLRIDHVEQGLSRLPEQFKDKPNIEGILTSWLTSVQVTEDRLFDLLNFRSIDTAIGVQLDYIGKIVGCERDGSSDSEYRDRIRLQILINTSEGTPNDILEITSLTTNGNVVKYFPHYPLGGNVYTNGDRIPFGFATTLTDCAPVSHGNIHVYVDSNEDALIPSELVKSSGILIDNNGNEIVDNNGNNILVGGLGTSVNENSWRGLLAELDGSITPTGIPCEIVHV